MAKSKGKQFEQKIKEAFELVTDVSIDRVHDQVTKYKGSKNICDFIVYKKPFEYYIECKSVHGNTLSIYGTDEEHKYGNISNEQWEGLLKKSEIEGVFAGVICWWVDKDVTKYLPITFLKELRDNQYKSIRYDLNSFKTQNTVFIDGVKKKIYFKYNMGKFLEEMENGFSSLFTN